MVRSSSKMYPAASFSTWRGWRAILISICAGAIALGVLPLPAEAAAKKVHDEMLQQDFPFQGACVGASFPARNVAMKGLAIRLGNDANMLFDTDLLRVGAGWTGGYIDTEGVAFDGGHGRHPSINGAQQFGLRPGPGWADARGGFTDPRPEPFGPLPSEWCRWDGLYVSGMDVVLAYTVHGTKIHEQPSSVAVDGRVGFVRTFKISGAKEPLTALVCEVEGAISEVRDNMATLTAGTNITVVTLVGAPPGVTLGIADGTRAVLKLAKGAGGLFSVMIWRGETGAAPPLPGKPKMMDVTQCGRAHWPEPVMTQGRLETSKTPDGAYVTDSITAPTTNPWKRRVRFGGFDFFPDGRRAAFCTHDGDIWIVSGLDETLEKLEWRRFASGMYETLGLAIVAGVIYTSGRDQITRYHDLNGDGEADYYENFNNQIMSTEGFHEFVFDLQADKAGNFYFAKANPVNGGGSGFGSGGGNGTVCSHSGCLFQLSRDGKHLEVIATGFRAPNGIGVRPDGQVTTSDNEGTWVPTTPINWISAPGQFCGVRNTLVSQETADHWTPPLAWLSKEYDNSGGGQIWVTSGKWGPFAGDLLHESYGKSSLFLVLKESIGDGRMQGGVVKLPLRFTSSVMRARFNPEDGQLYVAGLSEWQSNAAKVTGFDRVRYTGRPVYSVNGLRVVKGGLELTFTQPLDPAAATDAQNFSGKRWNYKRTSNYGSPEMSVDDPAKPGRDPISITGARLSQDGKTLTVEIADLKPVMQQSLKFALKAADGTPIAQEIQHTIHMIP